MSHFTGTWREGRILVLNRVRKRGFESAQSRGNKEGIATARSSAVAVAVVIRGRGGESLFQ